MSTTDGLNNATTGAAAAATTTVLPAVALPPPAGRAKDAAAAEGTSAGTTTLRGASPTIVEQEPQNEERKKSHAPALSTTTTTKPNHTSNNMSEVVVVAVGGGGGGKHTLVAARAAAAIAAAAATTTTAVKVAASSGFCMQETGPAGGETTLTTTNKRATVSPPDPTDTPRVAAAATAISNTTQNKNMTNHPPNEDDENEGTRTTLSSVFTGTLDDLLHGVGIDDGDTYAPASPPFLVQTKDEEKEGETPIHHHHHHDLFTQSFETISANDGSALVTREHQQSNDLFDAQHGDAQHGGVASPTQTAPPPYLEDSPPADMPLTSLLGARVLAGNSSSPIILSPPHRIIHVDTNGHLFGECGDISPIQFEPPYPSSHPYGDFVDDNNDDATTHRVQNHHDLKRDVPAFPTPYQGGKGPLYNRPQYPEDPQVVFQRPPGKESHRRRGHSWEQYKDAESVPIPILHLDEAERRGSAGTLVERTNGTGRRQAVPTPIMNGEHTTTDPREVSFLNDSRSECSDTHRPRMESHNSNEARDDGGVWNGTQADDTKRGSSAASTQVLIPTYTKETHSPSSLSDNKTSSRHDTSTGNSSSITSEREDSRNIHGIAYEHRHTGDQGYYTLPQYPYNHFPIGPPLHGDHFYHPSYQTPLSPSPHQTMQHHGHNNYLSESSHPDEKGDAGVATRFIKRDTDAVFSAPPPLQQQHYYPQPNQHYHYPMLHQHPYPPRPLLQYPNHCYQYEVPSNIDVAVPPHDLHSPLEPELEREHEQRREANDCNHPLSLPPLYSVPTPWMGPENNKNNNNTIHCRQSFRPSEQQYRDQPPSPYRRRLLSPPQSTPTQSYGNEKTGNTTNNRQAIHQNHPNLRRWVAPSVRNNNNGTKTNPRKSTAAGPLQPSHRQRPLSSNDTITHLRNNRNSAISALTSTTTRNIGYQGIRTNSINTIEIGRNNDPFVQFRSIRKVFEGCSYLLRSLSVENHQEDYMDPMDLKVARRRVESAICSFGGYVNGSEQSRDDTDTYAASESSIRTPSQSAGKVAASSADGGGSSNGNIFRRLRGHYRYRSNTSVICSPSTTGSSESYKDKFHQRYFVGMDRIIWKVEENPPVFVSDEENSIPNRVRSGTKTNRHSNSGSRSSEETSASGSKTESTLRSKDGPSLATTTDSTSSTGKQKVKYRCKLCGAPKQGHICPYRKSLQRTIGVMVSPAVNAYTSAEPGVLTPAISELHNFFPYGTPRYIHTRDGGGVSSGASSSLHNSSRGRSGSNSDTTATEAAATSTRRVSTPGSSKKTKKIKLEERSSQQESPPMASQTLSASALESSKARSNSNGPTSSNDPDPVMSGGGSRKRHGGKKKKQQKQKPKQKPKPQKGRKRSRDAEDSPVTSHNTPVVEATAAEHQKRPFVMSLALRPEHYRTVTPRMPYRQNAAAATTTRSSKTAKNAESRDDDNDSNNNDDNVPGLYHYPSVPLTYTSRKRLTDTLFYLCRAYLPPPTPPQQNSTPRVMQEVAALLHTARAQNDWDLAVAELLTQVVVMIYCCGGTGTDGGVGDTQLDGLQQYLRTMGIAS